MPSTLKRVLATPWKPEELDEVDFTALPLIWTLPPTSRFSIGVEVATGVRPDGDVAAAVTGAVVGACIVGLQ